MKITEDKIHTLMKETSEGKHTFPEHLAQLKPLGINSYLIDLENLKAHYYGEKEIDLVYNLPLSMKINVGGQWFPEAIKEAIHKVQKKELTYPYFLDAIAKAGVKRYSVDLLMKMTVYYGAHNEFIEPFPRVLCEMLSQIDDKRDSLM
jgi:uncharacterized protein YbcV (DUF1398 family)